MSQRLDELTLMYLDGQLSPAELTELETLLRDDDACRDRFCELTVRTHVLREIKPSQRVQPVTTTPTLSPFRERSVWYLAAAAMIALAVTAWFVFRAEPRADLPHEGPVALLADMHDAVFADHQTAMTPGGALNAGPIRLLAGKAQVMFNSAAVVDLIGPCEFHMTDDNHSRLTRGRIEVYVPHAAVGFTVDLPGGYRAVDLGTEFAVEVDTINRLLVHVTRGRVLVESPTGQQKILVAGQYLWRIDGEMVLRDDDPLALPPPGASPRVAMYTFTDDFDSDQLDTQRWRTLLPRPDSQLRVDSGTAVLTNRAYLISRDHFAAGPDRVLRLSGVFEFAGNLDFMQILTRAVPEPAGEFGETVEGVEFRLNTNTPDGIPVAQIMGRGKFHLDGKMSAPVPELANRRYRFVIEDRGDTATFTIGPDTDDATPVTLTASISPPLELARPIVIHNREGASQPGDQIRRTTRLEQLTIEYSPRPAAERPVSAPAPRDPS